MSFRLKEWRRLGFIPDEVLKTADTRGPAGPQVAGAKEEVNKEAAAATGSVG